MTSVLPQSSAEHYREQQRLTVATLVATRRAWGRMAPDFDASWRAVGPRLMVLTSAAQLGAARSGVAYVPRVLAETGITDDPVGEVNPRGFAGVAGDGRPLDSLLYGAVTTAKTAAATQAPPEALARGGRWLDKAVQTAVADAGRVAVGVGIAARPALTGYVRMLNPPSCSRCAVLAGEWYRFNEGFLRHPRCDCRHIPASESMAGDLTTDPRAYFDSLSESEQRRIFTNSGAQAIRDGADLGQVVNARRGATGLTPAGGRLTRAEQQMLRGGRDIGQLQRTDVYGRQVFVTTEGTTRRGLAGQRLAERTGYVTEDAGQVLRNTRGGRTLRDATRQRARAPRLMPESIYEIAEDREDAIRLLRRYGYIT